MESITSTYTGSAVSSGYAERLQQQSAAGIPAGDGVRRSGETTPGASAPQLGFQPSEFKGAEFTPYSPDSARLAADKKTGDSAAKGGQEQDAQVQAEVARLRATEAKVKAHEAAHKSAGGTMTGPVSYTYTRGPDGKSYITGGEVPIDVSPGKTPQETISRMQQVIQSALAPADPSPQDRAVAAQAALQQQQARQESVAASSPDQKKESAAGATVPGPKESTTVSAFDKPHTSSRSHKSPAPDSSVAQAFQPVSFYA